MHDSPAVADVEVLQDAADDPKGQGHLVSYQMYRMPPGIDNRDFLSMKRRRRAEGATGVFEQLNRSITWPSKPPIKKVMRASVYTYTRVESLAEEPQSSRVCMLMSTDLKGGLQSRMAGQMQRTMISRADDSAKAMIKELSKRAGGARHG